MQPLGSVKLLGSVFRPRAVHLHGLTGVGALLTCFAVILNVGPFAKAPKQEAVRAITEQSVGSTSITRPQIGAGTQPDRSQSTIEATDGAEPISPLIELSSTPDLAVARTVSQPVNPKDRDVETQPKPTRQDRGTSDPAAQPHATIVGVWAPDASACSVRNFREGLLPTIIDTDGAWAGETFCIFKNQKQMETGWKVVANCSNPRERWTADVRLTVKDNRLTWTSGRGSQVYTRCTRDFLMAAAR